MVLMACQMNTIKFVIQNLCFRRLDLDGYIYYCGINALDDFRYLGRTETYEFCDSKEFRNKLIDLICSENK